MRETFLSFAPPSIGEAEIDEVTDTLRSDWITTGPKVPRFEARFAELVEADAAAAVSSCTDALHVALAALGVGPGDAVFSTPMTFVSTIHVIEHVGATPVLVDIDPATMNLDPDRLHDAVKTTATEGRLRPAAILPVHYAGQPVELDEVLSIAQAYELDVIEDAAHALPASYKGRPVGSTRFVRGGETGSVRRAVAFSFYATKNLTTAEGGMLTGTKEFIDEARLWILHGLNRDAWNRYSQSGNWRYDVVRPGFKCNMTDIQASIGLHQLDRLPMFSARRRAIATRYSEAFAHIDALQPPTTLPNREHAWHLYPLRLNLEKFSIDREKFIVEMGERNIGTSVHFIPVHHHSYYRNKYGYSPSDFPIATREFEREVSLPIHPRLTDEDVQDVIDAVRDVCLAYARS